MHGKTLLLLFLALACTGALQADMIKLDLSGVANAPSDQIWRGFEFPKGDTEFTGVPFRLLTDASYIWFAHTAAGERSGAVNVEIPVNAGNVERVFTLMNTAWGQIGSTLASLTFFGSGGSVFRYDLVGGRDVRDHNRSTFSNTIGGKTTQVFSNGHGQRLDMQVFDLPEEFRNQTLNRIVLTDVGDRGLQRIFLAGVTVETAGAAGGDAAVPEPSTAILLGAGLALIGAGVLRRRTA